MRFGALLAAALLGLVLAAVPAQAAPPGRVAVLEDLWVDGVVEGDVVALGGDVILGPGAHVRGDVVALYGRVERSGQARVSGRIVAVDSLAALAAEHAPGTGGVRTVWGLRALVAGGWLLVTTLLAAALPRRLVRGEWLVRRTGPRVAGLGVLVTLTLFAALVAVLGLGGGLAVPGTLAVAGLFAGLKILGVAVLGGTVGRFLFRRVAGRTAPMPSQVFFGVLVLLVLRLVPVVGGLLWTVVSVWGVGAGVTVLAMDPAGLLVSAGSPRPE